jgi:phage gp29-like protein
VLKRAGLTRASLRILETDDEVAQCLDTRREALIATPWRIEPYPSPAAEFLWEQLQAQFEQLVRGAFAALMYGYSVVEVVYAQQGNRIGIAHLSEKPFEWFEPRPDGSLIYRPLSGEQQDCDPRKFLLTRRQASYRQPYGESLLSRLYWTVFFKTHGRKKWAQLLERYAEPLLVGKVRDQQKFIDDVLSLGIAAGLPIQPDDDITAIHATQAGEFERFENALSRSIQKLILGQTLTSDVGDSGSYAAAKVHDQVRQDKRHADIRLVTPTIQRLLDTLCELNGFPRVEFSMADDTGLEEARAQRDALLVEKGIIKLSKEYILDRYDFEEGHFEIPEQAAPILPAADQEEEEPEEEPAEMAASTINLSKSKIKFTPQQQAIEDETDRLIERSPQPIPADLILSAIRAASDEADLAARLALLLDEQDPRFAEAMARAQFAAQALGFAVADKEAPLPKQDDPLDREIKMAELEARKAIVEMLRA